MHVAREWSCLRKLLSLAWLSRLSCSYMSKFEKSNNLKLLMRSTKNFWDTSLKNQSILSNIKCVNSMYSWILDSSTLNHISNNISSFFSILYTKISPRYCYQWIQNDNSRSWPSFFIPFTKFKLCLDHSSSS